MKIVIDKKPKFENDMYLFNIKDLYISDKQIQELSKNDPYLKIKINKFKNKNICKEDIKIFKDIKPSLNLLDLVNDLRGSIYTYTVEERNSIKYDYIFNHIKNRIHSGSRRLYLRFCNSFYEYIAGGLDVSCLSNIHYLEDRVNLMFRASDIKNELFVDIITIYEFFIRPIYDGTVDVNIFASTSQNVNSFDDVIKEIKDKLK